MHFFFSFIFIHLFNTKNSNLKYSSLMLLIFSFIDNFGISGGRNGFIYIQEIGKQDTAVAILYCITSILLLDKIQKLGEIGDVVEVSSGYARNFLIPKKKAMFASDENLKYVESKKAELAAASADEMANAQGKADAVSGAKVEIKVPVTEEGTLYGSVGTREISDAFSEADHIVDKSVIQLPDGPLKELGDYSITLLFHPEVSCVVEVSVQPE